MVDQVFSEVAAGLVDLIALQGGGIDAAVFQPLHLLGDFALFILQQGIVAFACHLIERFRLVRGVGVFAVLRKAVVVVDQTLLLVEPVLLLWLIGNGFKLVLRDELIAAACPTFFD